VKEPLVQGRAGRKSLQALASQFRVLELCQARVRAREESERIRRGFAFSWQHFAYGVYPYNAALAPDAPPRSDTSRLRAFVIFLSRRAEQVEPLPKALTEQRHLKYNHRSKD